MSARRELSNLLCSIAGRLPGGRRLKVERDHATRQVAALHAHVDGLRERLLARTPDPGVLEHVLPLRARAQAAVDDPARRVHEYALRLRSAEYAAAATGVPSRAVGSVVVGGLTWWMPEPVEPRPLPLQEILQTRELAVGRVMIDIGANIGTTSLTRVLLGDFARAYAAEPDAVNYECLVRNVVDNGASGLVLPERLAIADRDGWLPLQRSSSRTRHLVADRLPAGKEADSVPCLRLDGWLQRLDVDPQEIGFVKSDTQGWDGAVLAGAPATLARKHIAWQIEYAPSMLRRARWTPERLFALLTANFTHFIDMRSDSGSRSRPVAELADRLAYIGAARRSYTNLLLYSSG